MKEETTVGDVREYLQYTKDETKIMFLDTKGNSFVLDTSLAPHHIGDIAEPLMLFFIEPKKRKE